MVKQIIIDGQQRITALRAAIKGLPVINDKYKEERIAISFNPYTEEFKVQDQSTRKGAEWIQIFLKSWEMILVLENSSKIIPIATK